MENTARVASNPLRPDSHIPPDEEREALECMVHKPQAWSKDAVELWARLNGRRPRRECGKQ